MRKRRTYTCIDCGQRTTRVRASIDILICFDCGIERAIRAAREMHAKSGPAYDKWLEAGSTGQVGPTESR